MSSEVADLTDASSLSVGQALTRGREERGLSIDVLAAQLKIPVRKLEMLERDEFEQIAGGPTYVRALCRSVCKALRLNEEPLLARLPQSVKANLPERDTSLRTPFRDQRGVNAGTATAGKGASPLLLAAGVLVVIAIGVFAWPQLSRLLPGALTAGLPGVQGNPQPNEKPGAVISTSGPTPTPTPTAAVAADSSAAGTAQSTQSTLASSPTLATSAPLAATSAPSAAEASAPGLSIQAIQTTWVEIKTPGGVVLVARNVNAGETLEQPLDGKARVTVGNASGTKVFVRGAPFDLAAANRDNVARFEVE
jgi:cytoskeleton protein RodZ